MKIISFLLLTFLLACGKKATESSTAQPQRSNEPTRGTESKDPLKFVEFVTPDNDVIITSIASSPATQTQGLQGIKDHEFGDHEGKLFFYFKDNARTFWMPNTFFNMDIIYLDKNLKITHIVWNISHYNGNINSEIPRAPTIVSRHVLEMKAGSPISSKLEIGTSLHWKSALTLEQTETRIRAEQ